jgi:hypothetical protein
MLATVIRGGPPGGVGYEERTEIIPVKDSHWLWPAAAAVTKPSHPLQNRPPRPLRVLLVSVWEWPLHIAVINL